MLSAGIVSAVNGWRKPAIGAAAVSSVHTLLSFLIDIELCALKRQILDSSKLKEFADDNFKIDKDGRKFSK